MNTPRQNFPRNGGELAELLVTPVTIYRLVRSVAEVCRMLRSSDQSDQMVKDLFMTAHRNSMTAMGSVELFVLAIRSEAEELGVDLSGFSDAQIVEGDFFDSLDWSPAKDVLQQKFEIAKENLDYLLKHATGDPLDFELEAHIAQGQIQGEHALIEEAMGRVDRQTKILVFHIAGYVGAVLVYASNK